MKDLVDEIDAKVGLEQLKLLHVNDSTDPLGSNRDRHAPIGKGEIGRKGLRAFLGERRIQGVPAVLEGPGIDGRAPDRKTCSSSGGSGARRSARPDRPLQLSIRRPDCV